MSLEFLIETLSVLLGAAYLGIQIRAGKRQGEREFVADFNGRYDPIVREIPLSILIDDRCIGDRGGLPRRELHHIERAIFNYFQLCEEPLGLAPVQKRLREDAFGRRTNVLERWNGDVWRNTAVEWAEGIRAHCSLKQFNLSLENLQNRASIASPTARGMPEPLLFSRLTTFLREDETRQRRREKRFVNDG
jgi:hypothetical protein